MRLIAGAVGLGAVVDSGLVGFEGAGYGVAGVEADIDFVWNYGTGNVAAVVAKEPVAVYESAWAATHLAYYSENSAKPSHFFVELLAVIVVTARQSVVMWLFVLLSNGNFLFVVSLVEWSVAEVLLVVIAGVDW
jgi:hypothetical protein